MLADLVGAGAAGQGCPARRPLLDHGVHKDLVLAHDSCLHQGQVAGLKQVQDLGAAWGKQLLVGEEGMWGGGQ